MDSGTSATRQAQLDKAEREHLEDVVTKLREQVEREVEYEIDQQYDLTSREGGDELSEGEQETREELVEAIGHENPGEKSWQWCYEQYVNGVGYTFINRLAALRCMEVRGFIDQPVTQIGESGLTPAAEQVLAERFDVGRNEALVVAFEDACERFDDEVELLFDTNSPYTVLDVDVDTFEESVRRLDDVPDAVWRADDVLGWVYEYYNVNLLDDLRRKGDREGLEPADVPAANQFYTPHWVVRMLTDNSLGKLYLEHTGELEDVVERQEAFTPDERKNRPLSPDESPDIADFCTYLVPSEEEGEPTEFDHPQELRVIDPACGSGHFLLYAFDVLERIWRAETDLDDAEIPRKILQHNLYGVDLDMRACQLAAFNLYLKGRTRAEAKGNDGFDMPEVGIVCADASIAETDGIEAVFDEVAGDDEQVADVLQQILDAFEEVHGLGSLLDVRGTLGDLFEDDAEVGGTQLSLEDDPRESHTLGQVLGSLREAVAEHRETDSFLAQDLRSFVRLLDILAQDYDVALMNPPYGTQNRMPDKVTKYVNDNYNYKPEFYINFFEVCDNLVESRGRVGMIIPRTFMFKRTFEEFRTDFIGDRGSFDFLAEYGLGVLDNATVRTAGTVIRINQNQSNKSDFYRLHDIEKGEKEQVFIRFAFNNGKSEGINRHYRKDVSEFSVIPGTPISYWVPSDIRSLYEIDTCFDASQTSTNKNSLGAVKTGLQTGNNDRFLQKFWEVNNDQWIPFAKGGTDAWILPRINRVVLWGKTGDELKRISGSRVQNEQYYFEEGLTYTNIKEGGKRFGYLHQDSIFGVAGQAFLPEQAVWQVLAYSNSNLVTYLMLALTTGRHWQVGEVSRLPWDSKLATSQQLKNLSKGILFDLLRKRMHDINSPFYIGPLLLSLTGYRHNPISRNHSHQDLLDDMNSIGFLGEIDVNANIREVSIEAARYRETITSRLYQKQELVDEKILEHFNIPDSRKNDIYSEITIRTNENPCASQELNPESITDIPDDLKELVKNLVHHFAMEAVRAEDDGLIPVYETDDQPDMLDQIVDRFEDAYGEHASDRLLEVDEILGSESASEEAYPNLRAFITEDLFDYHVDRMENTPILWEISTDRLVADVNETGFACFVDYHQLDSGLFDRLTTQYLDPRKDEIRNRQSTANQRRNNESLSSTARSEASDAFDRTTNMLDQINELENAGQELGSVSEREFSQERREEVEALAPKVAAFRAETKKRLDALAELRKEKGQDWFQDTFSDGFWEKVQEWDDEWLDALEELEHACEAYAEPNDEPVEAHLADLFDYFNWRLKGSDHYSSSGILFMTYYFERESSELLDDDGEPYEHLTDDEQLIASLATGLDDPSVLDASYVDEVWDGDGEPPALVEFKALAEEIDDRCQAVHRKIPSDWTDRALSEITTAGYQPNHKHGVAINIRPLADQNIVPEIVDDKML